MKNCTELFKTIKTIFAVLLVLAAFALGGCATMDLSEPSNDKVSLMVGYLDMSDAPASLDWIEVMQLEPKTDKPYFGFNVAEGVFYNSFIEPGTYRFTNFGGTGKIPLLDSGRYKFGFPRQGKGVMDPVVKAAGSVVFIGSYKYKKVETGIFEQGKFDIEPSPTPTEKEVLTKVLPYAKSNTWKVRIEKRLSELK